jgi:phosphoribosylformylglycinamidine (FGAM) synthase-like enzyme
MQTQEPLKNQERQERPVQPVAAPPVYTFEQIAKRWSCSVNHVRRVFEDEAGLLDIGFGHKRSVIRVPEHVLLRVEAARSTKGFKA